MSEITGTGRSTTGLPVVHESYSFACLRCGHGWEQSYEIEHHMDAKGKEFVVYKADGRQVPSPLTQPHCDHCDGHVVRIMRPGRVSTVLQSMHAERAPAGPGAAERRAARRPGPYRTGSTDAAMAAGEADPTSEDGPGQAGRHAWYVSGLLRLIHMQRRAR
ncbi:hypothetical protein [Streptomyces sp. TS71-3]|uniref:hypothetical protein n=1 Tax=Streptomyces sp. TS71-3 TaxID=2733862 RepID=UPI001AFE7459|nr:hypothetical protein [Streptomyces sp. TS71-3]GHJ39670.1 hypothetical protein Sm713_52790 [Streptomyces sp. TS71-3]